MQGKRGIAAENRLTDALVLGVLAGGPEPVVHRFVAEVCGVGQFGKIETIETQAPYRELPAPRAAVVGIARLDGVSSRDLNISGKAVIDGLIAGQDTTILLEHKISGRCEQGQLIRHALYWSLDVGRDHPVWAADDPPPPGYRLVTWAHVSAWLARERERGECDGAAAHHVVGLLGEHVAPSGPLGDLTRAAATTVGVLPAPKPASIREIAKQWDFDRLHDACTALFAAAPVRGTDCLEDTVRMREAFEKAGQPVPCGLRWHGQGGAMTPLRVLSVMYRDENVSDAWPPAWTGLRMRTIDRGADRAVLAAMLAWGLRQSGAKQEHTINNVPIVWSLAPERAPGLEHLHAAIGDAIR
jgi:hypothetical protein